MDNKPKDLRTKLNMTQKQFAAACGLPQRTLENWEEGKNKIKAYEYNWLKFFTEHLSNGDNDE